MATRTSRIAYAALALAVLTGIVIQIPVSWNATGGFYDSPAARVANIFGFYTILSNVLAGVTAAVIALRPVPNAPWFRAAWLAGLVGVMIAGVVHAAVLRELLDLSGWANVADRTQHVVVPILATIAWLATGPRGLATRAVALRAAAFPVAWIAFTMVRGSIDGFWPYPFMDVDELGLARASGNVIGVAVVFAALCAVVSWVDRRLASRAAPLRGR